MVAELPPPPTPLVERLEASFPSPYEHLWASDATPPAHRLQGEEPADPVRLASGESAANPIKLLLDRLGFSFRPLLREIRHEKKPVTGTSNKPWADPVPAGDPIPVDGGGKPPGG